VNLYRITAIEDGETLATRFAGSNADARQQRAELIEKFKLQKKQVDIEAEDFPTNKTGLLEQLNVLCQQADTKEE
jgi:hypothetical protein